MLVYQAGYPQLAGLLGLPWLTMHHLLPGHAEKQLTERWSQYCGDDRRLAVLSESLLGGDLPTNCKWVITPVTSGLTLQKYHVNHWGYNPLTKWDEPPSKDVSMNISRIFKAETYITPTMRHHTLEKTAEFFLKHWWYLLKNRCFLAEICLEATQRFFWFFLAKGSRWFLWGKLWKGHGLFKGGTSKTGEPII